jgi:hypothetical protein
LQYVARMLKCWWSLAYSLQGLLIPAGAKTSPEELLGSSKVA